MVLEHVPLCWKYAAEGWVTIVLGLGQSILCTFTEPLQIVFAIRPEFSRVRARFNVQAGARARTRARFSATAAAGAMARAMVRARVGARDRARTMARARASASASARARARLVVKAW